MGGWIEIGQTVISQIAPDMLFTVPEGNYSVRLTGAGIDETREITIERNKETTLDLGDIEIPEPKNGVVKFEIIPETAVVYVDDAKVDTTYPVRLSMGLHQVTAKASGYDTLSEYFKVEEETTTVKMNLAETATVSGNNIAPSPSVNGGSRITIEAPAGVDVYQDNLYKGIAPVTYTKTAGEHTITLRRTGYITRSYGITVPDDNQDVTYSFPELDPENSSDAYQNTISSNTISGNSVSGNTISGNSVSDNSIIDRK